MDWNMCLPRSFFWIWNLGGTHQLKRNPGLYFSPGNMHIITCTLHPPIVWDEIWWYTCPSCRNRGGKLQVGTTQQIESISFGLKTFFFRFRIRLNENYWFGICVFLGTRSNPFEPVHRPFEPVRACKKATFLAVRTRTRTHWNPYPFNMRSKPVQNPFNSRSLPVRQCNILLPFGVIF